MTRALLSLVVAVSLMASAAPAAASTPLPTQLSSSATIATAARLFVTVGEMSIRTAAVTRAGAVTFTVQNTGTVTHELVVIRTDLAEDQLPANADEPGKVREDGSLGESGDIAAGKTADFTLTLTPGHYVLICNEPGHYAGGMHATLVVVSYVGVTLNEMSINAETTSVPAGPVTFGVSNAGTVTHELVVLRTDTAFDKLPANLDEPGKVREDGSLGESGDIAAGRWSSFLLTLTPGRYVLICNEPGHYAGGMKIAFTVTDGVMPAPPPPVTVAPPPTTQPPTTIATAARLFVTVGEMSIRTAAVTRAGAVTFTVQNTGTVTHELVVIRTDLAEDQLPANADEPGKVREDGSLGESGDIAAGKTADFTLTLTPGHYVLICNEPGHYAGGMKIAFTVR